MKSIISISLAAFFLGQEVQAMTHKDKNHYRPFTNGRTPWYKTHPRHAAIGHPVDYKVPNFGVDADIASSLEHLKNAEAKYGKMKKISYKKQPLPYKVYTVPNFGVDPDILST